MGSQVNHAIQEVMLLLVLVVKGAEDPEAVMVISIVVEAKVVAGAASERRHGIRKYRQKVGGTPL